MNRVIHFEILSNDPEKSAHFYGDVFGWKIQSPPGPMKYWLVHTGTGGPGIDGGIMGTHFPQAVINTIETESLEETRGRIIAAGGKLVHGPHEVPGVGLHAYFTDPDGTMFGVMQAHKRG